MRVAGPLHWPTGACGQGPDNSTQQLAGKSGQVAGSIWLVVWSANGPGLNLACGACIWLLASKPIAPKLRRLVRAKQALLRILSHLVAGLLDRGVHHRMHDVRQEARCLRLLCSFLLLALIRCCLQRQQQQELTWQCWRAATGGRQRS